MKICGRFIIKEADNPAKSFSFGGRGGIWAILKDPTRVSGNYNGAIGGDLELVVRSDWRINDIFTQQLGGDVRSDRDPLNAILRVDRLSAKGKYLGVVEFALSDVSLIALKFNPGEKTGGLEWTTLTLVFDQVEVRQAH